MHHGSFRRWYASLHGARRWQALPGGGLLRASGSCQPVLQAVPTVSTAQLTHTSPHQPCPGRILECKVFKNVSSSHGRLRIRLGGHKVRRRVEAVHARVWTTQLQMRHTRVHMVHLHRPNPLCSAAPPSHPHFPTAEVWTQVSAGKECASHSFRVVNGPERSTEATATLTDWQLYQSRDTPPLYPSPICDHLASGHHPRT